MRPFQMASVAATTGADAAVQRPTRPRPCSRSGCRQEAVPCAAASCSAGSRISYRDGMSWSAYLEIL